MNAIVRSATYGSVVDSKVKQEELVFTLPGLSVLVLVLVLLFSALALVYVKDVNRQLVGFTAQLARDYATLQMTHDKLLLDRSVWSAQSRIQRDAEKIEMQLPAAKETVMISL